MTTIKGAAMTATQLKKWREKKKLKQTQLAQLLGVTSRTVGRWESGQNRVTFATSVLLRMFDGPAKELMRDHIEELKGVGSWQ